MEITDASPTPIPRGPDGSITVMDCSDDASPVTSDQPSSIRMSRHRQLRSGLSTLRLCDSSETNPVILLNAVKLSSKMLFSARQQQCMIDRHDQALLERGFSRSSCQPNSGTYAAFSPGHCREPLNDGSVFPGEIFKKGSAWTIQSVRDVNSIFRRRRQLPGRNWSEAITSAVHPDVLLLPLNSLTPKKPKRIKTLMVDGVGTARK